MGGDRGHVPVLLGAALAALKVRPDGRYVDATFGRGGHSAALLEQLGSEGRLLAIDRDPEAQAQARARLGGDPRFAFFRGGFSGIAQAVQAAGWGGQVDGVLLDLGVSSPQLDDPARGFSFREDGPLDMRMDPEGGAMSAAEWLARAPEGEIAEVVARLGEERFARRVARAIVARRAEAPLRTTRELAELCERAVRTREPGKHPATRTFQAIRMQVNDELGELGRCLEALPDLLAPGGRIAVITFHSLEDRTVKRFFQREARGDDFPPDLPVPAHALNPRLRIVGKAVRPDEAELARNPRARSAALRVAERLA